MKRQRSHAPSQMSLVFHSSLRHLHTGYKPSRSPKHSSWPLVKKKASTIFHRTSNSIPHPISNSTLPCPNPITKATRLDLTSFPSVLQIDHPDSNSNRRYPGAHYIVTIQFLKLRTIPSCVNLTPFCVHLYLQEFVYVVTYTYCTFYYDQCMQLYTEPCKRLYVYHMWYTYCIMHQCLYC